MSFPRYPSYKDSGVEWLGAVPGHWEVKRLSYVTEILAGHSFDAALFGFDGVPVIRMSDFGDGQVYLDDAKRVEPLHVPDRSLAQSGDVLLGLSGSISNFAIVREQDLPVAINQRVAMVRVHDSKNSMVKWFLQSAEFSNQLVSVLPETTILNISMGQLRSCNLPFPPLPEQTQIAAFLDRETAKIDELVAEQRRLMELLKEKRQAVISHAVTQGLNPHAPMKPSGIEWLGDVPAHWEVKKLKFLCDVQTGDKDTENAVDDGLYPFFVRSQKVERINSMAFACEAVLTAGDGVGVGKVFHYHNGPFDFHQRVYMMNNFREVSGPYLFHFFRENFYKVALEGGAKSTVDSLRRPVFMNFTVCVPPKAEQAAIVATVEQEAAKFDTLTTEAQRAINLLQERRTALISAAVTGQIDVRRHTGAGRYPVAKRIPA